MGVGLEEQLRALGLLRRDDGQPPELAGGKVHLLRKAKNFSVEAKCVFLILHDDTVQFDLHNNLVVEVAGARCDSVDRQRTCGRSTLSVPETPVLPNARRLLGRPRN